MKVDRLPGGAFGSRNAARRTAGLTLIELLVVIGIIAVLAAILLPSIARAKSHAQRTVCQNKLKQWALAMQIYTDENEGFIPRESAFTPGTSLNLWADVRHARTSDVWYNALPPLMFGPTASNYFYTRTAFYESSSAFHCPSARLRPATLYAIFSISLNSKLIKSGLPLNLGDLCQPSSTVMFLDNLLEGEATAVPGLKAVQLGQPSSYANRFSIRHGQRGNMIFWDLHTESLGGAHVVDTTPGPNYGRAIEPQQRVVWDPCPQ